ncbi:MAG: hypothetical protein IRY85_05775 [Micromonosporaceae bacterium]|nr:hypothetical protein [Micromonosporaceae bacterium]
MLADDGRELPVDVFEPAGPPTGVALVVPAMATPASYYYGFAEWLSRRAFRVVTFDYRDTDSPQVMKTSPVDIDRWAADVTTMATMASSAAGTRTCGTGSCFRSCRPIVPNRSRLPDATTLVLASARTGLGPLGAWPSATLAERKQDDRLLARSLALPRLSVQIHAGPRPTLVAKLLGAAGENGLTALRSIEAVQLSRGRSIVRVQPRRIAVVIPVCQHEVILTSFSAPGRSVVAAGRP